MAKREVSIQCQDGFELKGTLYEPQSLSKGAVVINSALGVPQRFYDPFASYLSDNGYAVITYDNRGIGESLSDAVRGRDMQLIQWGTLDLEAVLKHMLQHDNTSRLFLIGHSAGGQLIGLAPSCRKLSGVVFAPASSANWRMYPISFGIVIYFVMHIMIPLVCIRRDYFPAKSLGISTINAPAGVMSQWARWARQKDYLFSKKFDIDTSRYGDFRIPILAYGFDDDSYASEEAIEHLLSQFRNARIDRRRVKTSELGTGRIGHLGFFKEKLRNTLWEQTVKWLDELA